MSRILTNQNLFFKMATQEELKAKMAELDKQREQIAEQIRRLKPVTEGQAQDMLNAFEDRIIKQVNTMLAKCTNQSTSGTVSFLPSKLGYSEFSSIKEPITHSETHQEVNVPTSKNTNASTARDWIS